MKITTTRFSALEVDEASLILMQRGILGFERYKRFVLLKPSSDEPLLWLQAVDDPALAFVVANPSVIKRNYNPAIMEYELELLDIQRGEDIVLLSILTFHVPPLGVTANLRAPIVINTANRKGNQVVLEDPAYPIQYPVLGDDAGGEGGREETRRRRLDKLSMAISAA